MPTEQLDEKAIFNIARQIQSPTSRAQYLQQVCGADDDLLQRVGTLLQAYEEQASFLEAPAGEIQRTINQPISEKSGAQIGPYKLLQQIGEGGMGVVYMAEQHEPVRRKVALKIIKPGMDTRQVIARFEAERQALSLMDHPNIAKVLDAGTTESGRPYFVMELVKGQPITDYCDEHHLTPRQRLELLLPVCQAIQHAHQKGIIHRDIKPSNILVAEYDQQAVPKVIDFGVAKAIGTALTEKTMFTGLGQIVGTLEYMSPEQAKVNQLDIDTRSDIYSLGVLMYELLTGSTPFDKQRLRSAAWDEMLRIIREEEPPKPSTRLSDSHNTLPSISAQRHTEPAKLTKLVRGELDWIVMKALEKDRTRRYESASAFAADLERYLHDYAVEACPPSTMYRFKKLVRRKRAALATLAIISLTLIAGAAVSAWQAIRATDAEQQSKARYELARRAVDEMYTGVAVDLLGQQLELTAVQRTFLKKALAFYQEFANETRSDAPAQYMAVEALERVGAIQEKLGDQVAAEAAYIRSIKQGADLVLNHPDQPEFRLELAICRNRLQWIYEKTSRLEEADQQVDLAIHDLTRLGAASFTDANNRQRMAWTLDHLCTHMRSRDRVSEIDAAARAASKIWESLAEDFPYEFNYRRGLAGHYWRYGLRMSQLDGHFDTAESALREAESRLLDLQKEQPNDEDTRATLAELFRHRQQFRNARPQTEADEVYSRRSVSLYEKLIQDYPNHEEYQYGLGEVLENLALTEVNRGQHIEAEHHGRSARVICEKLNDRFPGFPRYEVMVARTSMALVRALANQQKYDEARQVCEQLLEWLRKKHGVDGRRQPRFYFVFQNSLGILSALIDADPPPICARGNLPTAITSTSDTRSALTEDPQVVARHSLISSLIRLSVQLAGNESEQFQVADLLTAAPANLRDADLALRLARRAVQSRPTDLMCQQSLGWAAFRMGDWEGAIEKLRGNDPIGEFEGTFILAMAHWQLGNKDQARVCFDRGDRWLQAFEQQKPQAPQNGKMWRSYHHSPAMLRRLHAEAATMLGIADNSTTVTIRMLKASLPEETRAAIERSTLASLRTQMANETDDFNSNNDIYAALAWRLATTELRELRDPVEAARLAVMDLALRPESGTAREALGAAYYRLGRFPEAAKQFDELTDLQARKIHSPRLDVFFFAAMTQWRLGHHQQARETYTRTNEVLGKEKSRTTLSIRAEAQSVLGIAPASESSSAPRAPEP